MKEERLREIEERAKAATPGPWWVTTADNGCPNMIAAANLGRNHIARSFEEGSNDSTFIAHARQDVEDLVREVRRLRKALGLILFEQNETQVLTTFSHEVLECALEGNGTPAAMRALEAQRD